MEWLKQLPKACVPTAQHQFLLAQSSRMDWAGKRHWAVLATSTAGSRKLWSIQILSNPCCVPWKGW